MPPAGWRRASIRARVLPKASSDRHAKLKFLHL